jgi:hypothetical protein
MEKQVNTPVNALLGRQVPERVFPLLPRTGHSIQSRLRLGFIPGRGRESRRSEPEMPDRETVQDP